MKLLVVEDNHALSTMIAAHLRDQGFAVETALNGVAAIEAAGATMHDAVILDLGLPDIDGMDVLRALRRRSTPTLILTARDSIAHRIAGLDAGADDYILKPFDLAEFDARLRAVLRRAGPRAPPRFSDLSLDATTRIAKVADQEVELTAREAALLELLIHQGDGIVVRDTIAESLFGPQDDFSINALEAIVSRLRRKLAGLNSQVRVETLRGIGYRLRVGAAIA